MAVALDLVNSVLTRLRESQVTDFSADYTKLILAFVNETKREVEDAWDWGAQRQLITFPTVIGTSVYTLTGAGQRARIKDAFNTTVKNRLYPLTESYYNLYLLTQTIPNTVPSGFRVRGLSGDDIQVTLFPTPGSVYTINFDVQIPSTPLITPTDIYPLSAEPVVLGSWARAVNERGEDGGTSSGEEWSLYRASLADHISLDAFNHPYDTVWEVV